MCTLIILIYSNFSTPQKNSEMCREHQEVENHWSRPEKSSWACKELIACPQHASYFECDCILRWEKEFKFIGRLPLGTLHLTNFF